MISTDPCSVSDRVPSVNLYFADNSGEWIALPDWGQFFIEIGRWVAQYETEPKNRLVVAVALPTRTFAATLTALGVMLSNANLIADELDLDRHFKNLCNLPEGTQVFYLESGLKQWRIARYEGVANDLEQDKKVESDEPPINIRSGHTRNGHWDSSMKNYVLKRNARKVRFSSDGFSPIEEEIGKPHKISQFLMDVLGEENAIKFATETQLDCVLLGNINTLKQEITTIPVSCKEAHEFEERKEFLQDILRVQNFMSPKNKPYRSEVLKVVGNEPPKTKNGLIPKVAIFDGATRFLKWRNNWQNSHWIVLLDRTESRFDEAVDEINSDYSYRTNDGEIKMPLAPHGSEIVVYERASQ